MTFARHFVRSIALLLLLNIGMGFCDCLRDPLPLFDAAAPRGFTAADHRAGGDGLPPCGDNCETCICHATLVVSETVAFAVVLAVSPLPPASPKRSSEPGYIRITHPPRA